MLHRHHPVLQMRWHRAHARNVWLHTHRCSSFFFMSYSMCMQPLRCTALLMTFVHNARTGWYSIQHSIVASQPSLIFISTYTLKLPHLPLPYLTYPIFTSLSLSSIVTDLRLAQSFRRGLTPLVNPQHEGIHRPSYGGLLRGCRCMRSARQW